MNDAEWQQCTSHQRPLPANRFMSPTDSLCILCKIEIREEDRPLRPLLGVLFRQPKPLKKRVTQTVQAR